MSDYPHGTDRGYRRGCGCTPCRDAGYRASKQWHHDAARGIPHAYPALGAQRRLQALACRGWDLRELSNRLGHSGTWALERIRDGITKKVRTATHEKIASLYDELCMLSPTPRDGYHAHHIRLTIRRSTERNWRGPLDWDDIDNDPEPVKVERDPDIVDEVVVLRILDGDRDLARRANVAEKQEVARRWLAAGRSLSSLEWTGWRVDRYKPRATPDGEFVQVGNRKVWKAAS